MKYEKLKEHRSVGNAMRFLDAYGNEIHGCIEYDSDTGYAVVYEEMNEADPHSPIIKKEKYHPNGMVVVDGIANPDTDTMNGLRIAHHVKPHTTSQQERQELVRLIRDEVMPRMGLIVKDTQKQHE